MENCVQLINSKNSLPRVLFIWRFGFEKYFNFGLNCCDIKFYRESFTVALFNNYFKGIYVPKGQITIYNDALFIMFTWTHINL